MTGRLVASVFIAVLISVSVPGMNNVYAQDTFQSGTSASDPSEFHLSFGVRTWINKWEIGYLEASPTLFNGAPALKQELKSRTSATQVVPMPTIGASYGLWHAAATYSPRASYDSKGALSADVGRRELDVNLGYAVLPRLLLSVGYKEATQDRVSDQIAPSGVKIRGVLVGLSGSAPLNGPLSLYGNVAYGRAREKADFPDAAGSTRFSGEYQIGELGLRYALGSAGQMFQNISISVGYRYQVFTAHGITTATTTPVAPFTVLATEKRDVRTYTVGPVVAIVASF